MQSIRLRYLKLRLNSIIFWLKGRFKQYNIFICINKSRLLSLVLLWTTQDHCSLLANYHESCDAGGTPWQRLRALHYAAKVNKVFPESLQKHLYKVWLNLVSISDFWSFYTKLPWPWWWLVGIIHVVLCDYSRDHSIDFFFFSPRLASLLFYGIVHRFKRGKR